MQRFILARVFQAVLTLLLLSLAVFLSVKLSGDPAAYMLGPEQGRIEYEMIQKKLGLDRPIVVQYWDFLTDIVRLDFGKSHFLERPARDVLFERFPATLQLAAAAFVLAIVVGVPLGILSAVKRDTPFDTFGKLFATLGIATPNFWIAIMLIMLFGAILGWLPTYGRGGIDHFILPAFVLGWSAMAGMVRLGRSSMLEVLDSEYVKFARIKGLGERLVIWKHAFKNAIIPLLTFSGLTLAGLLNGSVAVEVVFAWPGVGRLLLQGIRTGDFPIVQAAVMASGLLYILTALAVDILYAYVNPRIRYQ
ncbi:MAG: ABC transporter permease [Chloroflexi bacterium]|nr:ABC transporter permease [Chloroflexota bacterium]MCH8897238.1 ABC transporter permease [Chloroflexota bacterium]